jgi:hypothetical protein
LAFILVVITFRSPWSSQERSYYFTYQLLAGLIHADQRPFRVVRPLIEIQNVFHMVDELTGGQRQYAPFFF